MMVELSFMFIIILGRWILPKGSISHSALSQLLLVYLSLASDILDLLTLFNEQEIFLSSPMVHVVLFVFSCCMLQFALNLTATRGRSFRAEFDETEIEIHQSSQPRAPLSKPLAASRRLLARLIPKSFSSSASNARSRANTDASETKQKLEGKPRASSASVIETSDTILKNTYATRQYQTELNESTLGKPCNCLVMDGTLLAMIEDGGPSAISLKHLKWSIVFLFSLDVWMSDHAHCFFC